MPSSSEHKTAHRGKVRVIYLSDEAPAILREQQAEHPQGYLFRRPTGGRWTTHSITQKFARVSRVAGVKVTACCLRHSFSYDALANGVPDAKVDALLGHSGRATLHRHYSHLTARSQALRGGPGQGAVSEKAGAGSDFPALRPTS